jgi:two-component system sensor histidine kinase CreC
MTNELPAAAMARGERFLVRQALANLLDNAMDFTPRGGEINIDVAAPVPTGMIAVDVFNRGEPVPDYALSRVTERFYSLPRPGSGRKSTGLGLNFVQEVAHLHGGAFAISNVQGGVRATLTLPSG